MSGENKSHNGLPLAEDAKERFLNKALPRVQNAGGTPVADLPGYPTMGRQGCRGEGGVGDHL
jgi:hypothetical protein